MKVLDEYSVTYEFIKAKVKIFKDPREYVPIYSLQLPSIEEPTRIILNEIKDELVSEIPLLENVDVQTYEKIKREFFDKAKKKIKSVIKDIDEKTLHFLSNLLVIEMLGIGRLEFLIADPNLEEIVVNCSKEPIWVYHRKHGWLKSDVYISSEQEIFNIASLIGRRVGRQINILNPLLDAHLITGDRVNATLFPISAFGNTITIRKFRRIPWSVTDFIKSKTLSFETAAFLWQSVQYELNVIIAGGTGSGKTSLLNVILTFIPANQRIITIEQTRELNLPSFAHWVPLVTREYTIEEKGKITMYDLLVNSLRMRPDRIVVGEVRRAEEAEVLFEAMHTGHSVYATLHADTAQQAYKRLTNPPINIPEIVIESLHLFAVMYRDRRRNIRRLFQISEIVPFISEKVNDLFKWNPAKDEIERANKSLRIEEEYANFIGLTKQELEQDLNEKIQILKYLVKNDISDIETIGKIINEYYFDKESLMKKIKKK